MIKASYIEAVTEENKNGKHLLLSHDDSETLVVIFPGGNNICDRPILHYIRKASLIMGYDVMCISYTNINNFNKSFMDNVNFIVKEVGKAIDISINKKQYKKLLFISRSFGNIISGVLRDKKHYCIHKQVFLSPTKDAIDYISRYESLVITGTNDKYLSDENRKKLESLKNIELINLKGAGHSLETENNIEDTLEICSNVIMRVDAYIKQQ